MRRREFIKQSGFIASLGFAGPGSSAIYSNGRSAPVQFAVSEIRRAVEAQGGSLTVTSSPL